jgi:serine/threonine-protein kinase
VIEPDAVLQGRYHVTELLAQGGMADVFRARDATLDRDVAVKAFRVGAGDVRRFHAETRLLAALDKHGGWEPTWPAHWPTSTPRTSSTAT